MRKVFDAKSFPRSLESGVHWRMLSSWKCIETIEFHNKVTLPNNKPYTTRILFYATKTPQEVLMILVYIK